MVLAEEQGAVVAKDKGLGGPAQLEFVPAEAPFAPNRVLSKEARDVELPRVLEAGRRKSIWRRVNVLLRFPEFYKVVRQHGGQPGAEFAKDVLGDQAVEAMAQGHAL